MVDYCSRQCMNCKEKMLMSVYASKRYKKL